MANPTKAKDPSAAALLAIEDALNLTGPDQGMDAGKSDQPATPETEPTLQRRPGGLPIAPPVSAAPGLRAPTNTRASQQAAAPARPLSTPANDDRQSVGQILQALQMRTSRTPLVVAIAASVLWLIAIMAYALPQRADILAAPHLMGLLIAAALVPIAFFLAIAVMAQRTQELRISARSMAEVALRLAEPETVASDHAVSLSQTIRREVASMHDGIERALARAGELETVVRTEISNLERSYSENERRLRTLVDSITAEREAFVTNSDHVRLALVDMQQGLAKDVEDVSKRLIESVGNAGERVIGLLDDKGGDISRSLAASGEALVAQIDSYGSDILSRLSNTGSEITGKLALASEQVTEKLAANVGDLDQRLRITGEGLVVGLSLRGNEIAARIDETSSRLAETISERGDVLASRLSDTGNTIHEIVNVRGQALVDSIASNGEQIARLIEQQTESTQNVFEASGASLGAQLDDYRARLMESTQTTLDLLANQADTFTQTSAGQLEAFERTIGTHEANLQDAVSSRLGGLGETLQTQVEQLASETRAAQEDLTGRLETLRELSQTHTQSLTEHTGRLQHLLTNTSAETISSLTGVTDQIITQIDERLSSLTSHLSMQGDSLERTLSERTEAFASALNQGSSQVETTFNDRIADLLHALGSHGNQIDQAIGERVVSLETTLSEYSRALHDQTSGLDAQFSSTAGDAVTAIGMHTDRIIQVLGERLAAFEDIVSTHGAALADRVETQAMRFTDGVMSSLSSVEAAFTNHGDTFHERLAAKSMEVADLLEGRLLEFDARTSGKAEDIGSSLENLMTRIDSGLDSRAATLSKTLSDRAMEIARVLGDGGRDVATTLDARVETINRALDDGGRSVVEAIDGKVMEIARAMNDGGRDVAAALDSKVIDINRVIADRSTHLTTTLSEKALEINATLGGRATEIAATLDDRILQFEERVVGRLDLVSSELDERGKRVAELLGAKVDNIGSTLQERLLALNESLEKGGHILNDLLTGRAGELQQLFDEKTPRLVQLLTERGGAITSELASIGEAVTNALEQRGSAIVENMGRKQNELTAAINNSSSGLRDAIEAGAATSVASLTTTNARVRNELGDLLERLGHVNEILKSVVGGAATNLSSVENTLSSQVRIFQASLGAVTQQVASLEKTSTETLSGADTLATRLTTSNEMLNRVVEHITSTQREVEDALETRTSTIAELLDNVGNKADAFERILGSFTTVLNESLRRAENRAQEIGSFLSEHSKDVTGVIDARYEEIRAESEKERERTALALRSAYEQAISEMSQVFGSSVERFRTAAAEMRNVSSDVQRELETTRQELRLGATELPREAAEQTAAMRRVVAEQVRALAELTEIVTRSGRSLDIVEPAAPPRRIEPTRLPPVADFAPEPAPLRPAIQPRNVESYRQAPDAAREEIRRMTMRPVAAPLQGSAQPADRGPGWLSDLLARASEDEPAGQALNGAQSLDSLSVDIARMIEHDAAVDLWDRYNRGERNAFSRKLYTKRGQQTFDDVRRRYRSDDEFRKTVDQYVSEFERLVSEVSRDDRDGSKVRGYLTSDTGKVYTLLAHAAGRFD